MTRSTYLSAICATLLYAQFAPAQEDARAPHDESHLKNADGSWKYTNRLIDATSPYLLQHAHNPVDWYPWGEEAFAAARDSGKPILLSVGYSTCYWCHVMERKVFTNIDIAEAMNEAFINIKLDREERPDIDQIYMLATQLMTGSGGWPNNVFLTHDLNPFFAGTYFGPENVVNPDGSLARPGFPLIIDGIANVWETNRAVVDENAAKLDTAIQQYLTADAPDDAPPLSIDLVDAGLADQARYYDDQFGGFGVQPKFPNGYHNALFLDAHKRTSDAKTRDMALATLRHIARGGIHDHTAGGFHRYATDQQWNVPHFEKMLYNQGQLGLAFALAYAETDDIVFKHAAMRAFDFVAREMTSPEGAFYSAIDAETDAVEGATYVWTTEQARDILSEPQFALFSRAFTLTPLQEFPGHPMPDGQVLHLRTTHQAIADELAITTDELLDKLEPITAALLDARQLRKQPRLDDKVITGWNAIMIDALSRAGVIFDDPELVQRAERAATCIHERLRTEDGSLARIWRQGEAQGDAFLDDCALLARAYLSLSRALDEQEDGLWLARALDLRDAIESRFADPTDSAYFYAEAGPDLIARSKSPSDGAIPSGNSAMAHLLLDISEDSRLDDDTRGLALAQARRILSRFTASMAEQPGSQMHMLHAVERWAAMQPAGASIDLPGPNAAPTATDSAAHVGFNVEASDTVRPSELFVIRITLDIDQGWHVSATPPSLQFLIPTTIDVRHESGAKIDVLDIAYPEGDEVGLGGDLIRAYSDGTVITVSCQAPEEAGAVSVRVVAAFQACDDSVCLRPAQQVKTAQFAVVE